FCACKKATQQKTTAKAGCPILRVFCEGWDSNTAFGLWVAQPFSAAKRCFLLPRLIPPEAANLLIIRPSPPLPPAPAWSAESALVPARVRCCRTTLAKCVLHRRTRRRQ